MQEHKLSRFDLLLPLGIGVFVISLFYPAVETSSSLLSGLECLALSGLLLLSIFLFPLLLVDSVPSGIAVLFLATILNLSVPAAFTLFLMAFRFLRRASIGFAAFNLFAVFILFAGTTSFFERAYLGYYLWLASIAILNVYVFLSCRKLLEQQHQRFGQSRQEMIQK